ncbi:MAG TPA: CHAD domain-containing protein, partial [Solirubrobacteraceae bacterium]|nr:CHAD domain-containing protein [Solirubrobacteraceae bacterium]
MARARDVEGLDPGTPFARAAARAVCVRAEELFEHSADVLDTEDIERVHDMRVATRRLRAVLEIFAPCFPEDEHRPVLKDVKRLADALGARRDPDVQLDVLDQVAGVMRKVEAPGLAALAARLRAEQAASNETLAAALQEARDGALAQRLRALVAAAQHRAEEAENEEEVLEPAEPATDEPAEAHG